jgi:hypothetical protein
MTYHKIVRRDSNSELIKTALERFGFVVIDESQGTAQLDLFAYKPRQLHVWYFIEVKNPDDAHKIKLTEREAKFILAHPEQSRMVESVGDAQLLAMGKLPNTKAIYEARQRLTKIEKKTLSKFWQAPRF